MDKVTRLPLDHDRAAGRRRLHIREVSDNVADSHATVGDELRAARLRLGEDLRTIAATLRIRSEHLEALEEGRYDELPGRAYAIGFVRSYAEYLGLDAAAVVARFKEEARGLAEPTFEPPPAEEEAEETRQQPQGMLIFGLAILVIGAGLGAWYISNAADRMKAPKPASAPAENDVSVPASKPIAIAPAPSAPATASPPTSAVASGPDAPVGGTMLGVNDGTARVEIRSLRNGVWLRVEDQASGEVLISRTMSAGDRFLVPNRPNLVGVTRDAGSLELILDGTSLGAAGPRGAVLDGLSLNPDDLSARAVRGAN